MVKLPFRCGCSQDTSRFYLMGLVSTWKYCNWDLHLGDLWPYFLPAPPTSPAWEMLHGSCFGCCITHTHPSPHGQQYVPLCGCHWQSKNPSDIQRRSVPEGKTSGPLHWVESNSILTLYWVRNSPRKAGHCTNAHAETLQGGGVSSPGHLMPTAHAEWLCLSEVYAVVKCASFYAWQRLAQMSFWCGFSCMEHFLTAAPWSRGLTSCHP